MYFTRTYLFCQFSYIFWDKVIIKFMKIPSWDSGNLVAKPRGLRCEHLLKIEAKIKKYRSLQYR